MTSAAPTTERRLTSVRPPDLSGRPQLAAGDLRIIVDPAAGGRIAAFWREDADGRCTDVVVPMPVESFDPQAWPKAGIYPLAPWSNRIREARFAISGRTIALPAHPACPPHALHGFSHMRPWTAARTGDAALTMRFAHDPDQEPELGWPWRFDVEQHVRLDRLGLTIEISIANRSAEAMPAGLGVHPFLVAAPGDHIEFAAGATWDIDDSGCAIARRDLESAAARPRILLGDDNITAHYSDCGGVAALARSDGSRIIIQSSSALDHLVAHAPAHAQYACIEPVSHVVDAFNLASRGETGTGFAMLEPNDIRSAIVRISLA